MKTLAHASLLACALLLAQDVHAQTATSRQVERPPSVKLADGGQRTVWVPAQGNSYSCAAGTPRQAGTFMRESEARQRGRGGSVNCARSVPAPRSSPTASGSGKVQAVN